MRRLNDQEKEFIYNQMNPPEHNHRNCNFFRLINENEYVLSVEVGYWITYIGCRPKYQKEICTFQKSKLREFLNN